MSVSGSAVFLAGEAGTGFAEEVVLVSATMFIYLRDLNDHVTTEVRECLSDLNDHVERKKN